MADSHHPYLYYQVKPANASIAIDFSITRQILFVFVSALVLLVIVLRLSGKYKQGVGRDTAPKGTWQNMMEVLIAFVRDEVAKVAIGPKYKNTFLICLQHSSLSCWVTCSVWCHGA